MILQKTLKKVLPNIFYGYHFLQDYLIIRKFKKQQSFEIEISGNIVKVLTDTFDQSDASLLRKRIHSFKKSKKINK